MQRLLGDLWGCAGPWYFLLCQQAHLQHVQQDLSAYGELKLGFSPFFFAELVFHPGLEEKKKNGKKKSIKQIQANKTVWKEAD